MKMAKIIKKHEGKESKSYEKKEESLMKKFVKKSGPKLPLMT